MSINCSVIIIEKKTENMQIIINKKLKFFFEIFNIILTRIEKIVNKIFK